MKQLHHLFRRALLAVLLCCGMTSWAQTTVTLDEVTYTLSDDGTCAVTDCETSKSGELVIPASIVHDGSEYAVTSIGYSAFEGCYDLTSVTIHEGVASIGSYAFSNCYGLTSVEIPSSVTSIGDYAFSNCSGLTSIEIPSSVTSIGYAAFSGCSGLTSVEIPSSVTSIGNNPFSGCRSLTEIDVDADNPNYSSEDGLLLNKEKTTLITVPGGVTTVTIPSSVTSIGDYAFWGCSGLTSIVIPGSVTSIGDDAFSNCYGLTSIEIPSSVTSIGNGAFYGCSGLTSVEIPSSVTSIGNNPFSGCRSLTEIDVDADNPNYSSEDGLLLNKEKTTLAAVPGGVITVTIPGSVTSIGDYAFWGCSGLTSIVIPGSVTSIGDYAFFGCSGLTSIELPSSVTSIGEWAFLNCSGLTSIEIPGSVTSISGGAFSGCSGLTSVEIPGSVTSIGYAAFSGCSGLTSVEIPSSVTSIGEWAFSGCSGLTSVEFKGATPPSGIDVPDNSDLRIIVPVGCGEAYRTAYPSVADKIGEKAVVEYFETATAYISDFIAENEPNVGTGLLNVNEAKLNKLKALLTPLPTTIAEADERIANLPAEETLTAVNYKNIYIKEYVIRNVRSGKYVSSFTEQEKPAQVTRKIMGVWRFISAGETVDGITPVKFYNEGSAQYFNDLDGNVYTADAAEARIWYVKATASGGNSGYAISRTSAFGDNDCWNDYAQNRVGYYSIDGGSIWAFDAAPTVADCYTQTKQHFTEIHGEVTAIVNTNLWQVDMEKLETLDALLEEDYAPSTYKDVDDRFAGYVKTSLMAPLSEGYFRFTNTGRGKVLGINAAGKPAGVDASEKDIDQLWQLKPSGSGFKIFHPNTGKYISGMTAGSPAPAATMVDEANARVYTIRVADAAAGTFRFAYSSEEHDCINMEGSGYSSGDYILDSWGGTYSVFTAAAVEEVQVDLRAASIGGAYASVYLPFAVSNASDGVKAYVGEAIDGDILNMRTEAEIAANAGFILTADAATTATLHIGASETAAPSVLSGTTTTLTLNDDNRADYLLFGVKKVSAGETASLGFFRPAASIATIAANRAFLPNDGSLNAVRLMFGSNVTDIELLPEDADDDAPVYDLTGRRVVTLRKGMVYVKNGKKFVY